ncbi:MAG: hypothetical protein IH946_10225, partial [Bacteroidetes bacterium]|nr:hypothetical protein [Bacteroidota bacterium]
MVSCTFLESEDLGKDMPLARVHDDYLYYDDLKNALGDAISNDDSSELVSNYVENWVKQKLLIRIAEDHLSDEQRNVDQKIEDYRRSLNIFLYEKELIRQKLDTVVSENEITEYYENSTQDFFELKTNIVQFRYAKIKPETPKIDSLRYWIKAHDDNSRMKFEDYCSQYAILFHHNDTSWVLVEEAKGKLPEIFINDRDLWKKDGYREYVDEFGDIQMLNVADYRTQETV